MENLLEELKIKHALYVQALAKVIAIEGGQVFSAESESFGIGQEIWWKPDPHTSEMGPGRIFFRIFDYPLLQEETVNHGPQMVEGLPHCSYAQVVSSVLVELRGTGYDVVPSTITKWGYHPFDDGFTTSRATSKFVLCECDSPRAGPHFDIDYSSCGEPFKYCICCICGAIVRIPV